LGADVAGVELEEWLCARVVEETKIEPDLLRVDVL
jgi:hypothetical protein